MPFDFQWWSKIISSSPARPPHCAGFKLKDFESATGVGLKEGTHYLVDGVPRTVVCDHENCQIGVEYEYFFMWLVAQNHLNPNAWKCLRPKPDNRTGDEDENDDGGVAERRHRDNAGLPNYCHPSFKIDGCCGFKLADGPLANRLEPNEEFREWIPRQAWHYNPVSCAAYTVQCGHNGDCDPWALVRWIMIKLIATQVLPEAIEEPWRVIEEEGWRACLHDAESYQMLMRSPSMWPRSQICWRPENVERIGGDDEAENRFRLRYYYKAVPNGPLMIHLKRSPKTGNADMYMNFLLQADTLPLIDKLCTFWVSAGQNKDQLRAILAKSLEAIDSPPDPRATRRVLY